LKLKFSSLAPEAGDEEFTENPYFAPFDPYGLII
jgi:hypothetical protein